MSTASKKIVLAADGLTATVTDATVGDIFTSVISMDTTVTGLYGVAQKGLLFVSGMGVQSRRMGGSLNPFAKPAATPLW